jgi:hypothetical protein
VLAVRADDFHVLPDMCACIHGFVLCGFHCPLNAKRVASATVPRGRKGRSAG